MILNTQSVLDQLDVGSDQVVVNFVTETLAGCTAALEAYTGPLEVIDLGVITEDDTAPTSLQVTPLADPRPFLERAGLDISAGTVAAPFGVIPVATLLTIDGPTDGTYAITTNWPAVAIPADTHLWAGHFAPDAIPDAVRSALRATMRNRWASEFGTVSPTYDQIGRANLTTPFVVPVGALEMLGKWRWGGIV